MTLSLQELFEYPISNDRLSLERDRLGYLSSVDRSVEEGDVVGRRSLYRPKHTDGLAGSRRFCGNCIEGCVDSHGQRSQLDELIRRSDIEGHEAICWARSRGQGRFNAIHLGDVSVNTLCPVGRFSHHSVVQTSKHEFKRLQDEIAVRSHDLWIQRAYMYSH